MKFANTLLPFLMESKINVLFVVSEFWQAGTQRFTYELDRALNKDRFSVEILCLLPLETSDRFNDYYYPKHRELGSKIHFLHEINHRTTPTLKQKIEHRLVNKSLPDERLPIKMFFNKFDCISIMGEYNYKEIARYLSAEHQQKLLIHVQNSTYQVAGNYEAFPKSEVFHFVSGFHDDQIKYELSDFKLFKHTYYNLNFSFQRQFKKNEYRYTSSPKLGIFTRLTPAKPLDPFMYAFQRIVEEYPEAELHIYGSGDPVQEGISRYVEQLRLEKQVKFRGHQDDIIKSAVEDQLDLVWGHGYHGLPGGWVSFDLSTAGFPQLFWNFGNDTGKFHSFFPMFNSVNEMAEKSLWFLSHPSEAKRLADEQFSYTNENYNISKNIHVMEELYLQIAKGIITEK